jgi:hypothetical protein
LPLLISFLTLASNGSDISQDSCCQGEKAYAFS